MEEYTLNELKNILDEEKRKRAIAEYEETYAEFLRFGLISDDIKKSYGESLSKIYEIYESLIDYYTSRSIFPNDIVQFYPYIKSRKSRSCFYDDFGYLINKGSIYFLSRPLIWNFTSGESYILTRTMISESEDYLPKNLHEFESLYEQTLFNNDESELSKTYDGGFTLKKLHKPRKLNHNKNGDK